MESVWYQWKVYGINQRCMAAMEDTMEGYGSNGRCMVAMEGVW